MKPSPQRSSGAQKPVIPAQAGIQTNRMKLDSRLRGNDGDEPARE
jgi:hypothetical protein